MKGRSMTTWMWDGGSGLGWFSEKVDEVTGMIDKSMSLEMEKLRELWEGPIDTVRSVGNRFYGAYSHVSSGFTDSIAEQRATMKKKLASWITSIEVAVIGQYRLMERALYEGVAHAGFNTPPLPNQAQNPHLVSLGYVKEMPIASRSTILGENLETMVDVPRTITLRICDFEGKTCNFIDRHVELRSILMYDDGEEMDISVSRAVDIGEYNLCFRASRPGRVTLSVKLHGADVAGSPQTFLIHPHKNWALGEMTASCFGAEGDGPGDFQRPWGVGCDRQGRLLVADRSNNRVQVLRDDGTFLFDFGKKGTAPGEFQLVSAVAGAPNGDLVVVDKDNHRIQVFNEDGRFKFTFGGLGEEPGNFHYPWDVDVNARGEIIVTDSRNSRIQLFSPTGKFVKEFSRCDFKELDSPRGVSFINTNEVVVSDFNKHFLIIINLRTKKHKLICCEGSEAGQLRRPQGVAWHPQGFIVVGDSRNNRVQAVNRYGVMLWAMDLKLPNHGGLDRPCGVAVTRKGDVVAIDFGNNRLVKLQ